MNANISVVIPSYNSVTTISESINHILNTDNNLFAKEIIVVDSSDDKKCKTLLESYENKYEKIRVIHAGIRVIPAIGRNIGAKEAKGEILVFLDSDAFPDPNWLSVIQQSYNAGCKVGGGSYKLPSFQLKNNIARAQYYLQFNEFLPAGKKRIKPFSPSCNLFCDRILFLESDGFPELRASEDTMFCLKISKTEKFWFIPDAIVNHIFRLDKKAFANNQFLLGKYIIIYRKDHYNSLIYKGFLPVFLLPAFLLIKIPRIMLRIFTAGTEHIKQFVKSFFMFTYGMWFWTKGFLNGCFTNK